VLRPNQLPLKVGLAQKQLSLPADFEPERDLGWSHLFVRGPFVPQLASGVGIGLLVTQRL